MKLAMLLAVIAVAWCVLGALVLGAGVLVYPLAWAAVAATLFGVHKLSQLLGGRQESLAPQPAPRAAKVTAEETAALAR